MKLFSLFLLFLFFSCQTAPHPSGTEVDSPQSSPNGAIIENDSALTKKKEKNNNEKATDSSYANTRFRQVKVEKTNPGTYRITGEAQIFEASFSWVVEDGHNEVKKGYAMTDAGAPQWGHFDFTIGVAKPNPALTLTLLLFETSPKDGSRQYVLPIPLP